MSIASLQLARCRSCQAEIVWRTNDTTGKRAPIDAAPDPAGPCIILEDGRYHVLTTSEREAGVTAERRTNHFQTCPHRDQHRKQAP